MDSARAVHRQPAPGHPCLPTGLSRTGEMPSLHRCSPAAAGRRNKRLPSLHPCLGVPAVGHCAVMGESWHVGNCHCASEEGHCGNPSRGLPGASLRGPSTASLQKASQLCSKTSQFPAVCLFVPPSKGFSSWKLLLHQVLVRKPLAERHQLPSSCQWPHPLLLAHLCTLSPSSCFPEQAQEPCWAGLRPLLASTARTPLLTTLQNRHWGARSQEYLHHTGQLEPCHCP